MAPRLKAAAQPVPQSQEEADRLLGEIGALSREVARIEADLTDQVERAKAAAKQQAAPLAEAIKAKFQALTAWAEANKAELLGGKRRSLQLTHGAIGWRWGSPAVRIKRGCEEAVVTTLERLGLDRFLRVKRELNREAILEDPAAVEGIAGVAIERAESFWAKPAEMEIEQVATVQKLTGAAVAASGEEG